MLNFTCYLLPSGDVYRNNVVSYYGAYNLPSYSKFLSKLNKLKVKPILELFGTSQQTADGDVYHYTWDPKTAPNDITSKNVDVARVNAFYITNIFHDVMYRYGFTEKAFNFQADNGDKGGKGGDRIEMQVQAFDGVNNANFATPPEYVSSPFFSLLAADACLLNLSRRTGNSGQMGHCNMYLWTDTTPMRDGDLENDIITHELTHGMTNRMTGGGTGQYVGLFLNLRDPLLT